MSHTPLSNHHLLPARLGAIHGLAVILATSAAILAAPGCVVLGDTSGGDETSAAEGDLCQGARSSFAFTSPIAMGQDPVKGQCLARDLNVNEQFQVPCFVIEGRSVGAANAASCNACTGAGRAEVYPVQAPLVERMKAENPAANLDCFCNIQQVHLPNPQEAPKTLPCQMDPSEAPVDSQGNPVDGFCYVDPGRGFGDAELVQSCPDNERRLLRFVGAGVPVPSSIVYLTCVADQYTPPPPGCGSN